MEIWESQSERAARLTQLSDVVLADVAGEGDWTGELRRVGSSVVQPEALMLAHLGGGFPRRLYNRAVHHLGVERRRRRDCSTETQASAPGRAANKRAFILNASCVNGALILHF